MPSNPTDAPGTRLEELRVRVEQYALGVGNYPDLVKLAQDILIYAEHEREERERLERALDEAYRHDEAMCVDRESLRTALSVLDGTACAEEQQAGNGPCGICKTCLRTALDGAEKTPKGEPGRWRGCNALNLRRLTRPLPPRKEET